MLSSLIRNRPEKFFFSVTMATNLIAAPRTIMPRPTTNSAWLIPGRDSTMMTFLLLDAILVGSNIDAIGPSPVMTNNVTVKRGLT